MAVLQLYLEIKCEYFLFKALNRLFLDVLFLFIWQTMNSLFLWSYLR